MKTRSGFTLVEVLVAITILAGTVLGMTQFTRSFTRSSSDASVTARASDAATQQLETVKAWRTYSTLVSTYHNADLTFAATGPYRGLRRRTYAVRTGPNATTDHVMVTVEVTGAGLPAPVKRSTVIAGF
jgi:prepilin-type N-terminal cleavage/methylation domain-containing protein